MFIIVSVRSEIVSPEDCKFINIEDFEIIFDIILASNYLDIKSLLDLSCAKIASLIKGNIMIGKYILFIIILRSIGKTPEEIRKTFNIQNDLTPEEEAIIREENKWAEDAN